MNLMNLTIKYSADITIKSPYVRKEMSRRLEQNLNAGLKKFLKNSQEISPESSQEFRKILPRNFTNSPEISPKILHKKFREISQKNSQYQIRDNHLCTYLSH